ncbi:MAG: hypothetical protein JKY08_02090 [Flavobacteriaceae bacterium]|nr:hypothetical protein [Flavobacteriaceae bacterium]
MNIKFYYTFLILLFSVNLIAQKNRSNDLNDYNLNGLVKFVKEDSLKVIDRSDKKTKQELHIKRFYSESRTVSRTFNKEGNITQSQVFTKYGKPIKILTYEYHGKLKYKAIDRSLSFNNKIDFWNFKYDEKDNMVETIIGSEDGKKINERATFEYDNNKNRIRAKQYRNSSDHPNLFIYYRHDIFDNLREEIVYEEDSTVFQKHIYTYDNQKRKIYEEHYTYMGMSEYLSDEITSEYNKNNDVIDELRYDHMTGNMNRWTFEYVYDEFYNWIEKKEYFEGKLLFINTRKIKYYDE